MKILKQIIIISLVLLSQTIALSYAQTVKTVGGVGANYQTLKSAFNAINTGVIQGAIILQITGSTTETSSAVLNASGKGSASYSSITIYPNGSGYLIGGDFNAMLIDLSGADNVTIDGRVNQSGIADLTIVNANTGSASSTIRFLNSAENNDVKYCNIKGSSLGGSSGVLLFSSSSSGNGNDNDIIENCNITNASNNRPINLILSSGTSGRENSNVIIRDNSFFNFFNAGNSSNGLNISASSDNWTVSGNSFFETTTFTPTASVSYYVIKISTPSSHLISNNYIGGSTSVCGGTAWTVNSNFAHYYCGIFVSAGTTSSGIVQSNIIQNINYISGEDNPWDGIFINSGNVNVIGNTIGATTGTGSIVVTTPVALATTTISGGAVNSITVVNGGSGYTTAPAITFSSAGSTSAVGTASVAGGVVTGIALNSGGSGYTSAPSVVFYGQTNNYSTSHGMINNSNGTVVISSNNIGSITTVGSLYYSHGFESIYVRGVNGSTTISNNLIGSLTTANSIHVSSAATLSLIKEDLYGIYGSGLGTTTITGNTVANLSNDYTGTNSGTRIRGIQTLSGSNVIQNNVVRNITAASGQNSSKSSASLIGISQTSTTAGTTQVLNENTVYGLLNTNSSAKVDVYGIYYAGPTSGTNFVSRNFIHSLTSSSSNVSSDIEGIMLNYGYTTCANNIINLGVGLTTGYTLNGIWDESDANNYNKIYFNSIYLGGTISSGVTSSTAALKSANNTSTRVCQNNILSNMRTGGNTGKHYAIIMTGIANITIDYNDYYVSGTNGILGKIGSFDKSNLAVLKSATGQDINSVNIAPLFDNAGGTTPADYHISAALAGYSGTGVLIDFSGVTRGSNPKMGALEVNNYVWQGNTSTDFGTASNWTGNMVPPDGADIEFAANPARSCVLDQNRTLGNISNAQSTDKLVVNGKQLTISGNLIFTNGAQIDATASLSSVIFSGTSVQNIPSNSFSNNTIYTLSVNNLLGLTLSSDLIVVQTLNLINGSFEVGSHTLTMNGDLSVNLGALQGGSTSNIVFGGTGSSTNLPGITLNNLTINRGSGIQLSGDVNVGGLLTLTLGALAVGANTLTILGNSLVRTNGTIDASDSLSTIVFANSVAITLPASMFSGSINNLTISGTGGLTAGSNFGVNGALNLQNSNPSDTKGVLDMGSYTLQMGANATTIGEGDVKGIVKRTTIIPGMIYTFGNEHTYAYFPNIGTLPTEISVKINFGTQLSWRAGAIKRDVEIIQLGGSGTKAVFSCHYLDSELNNNNEDNLALWVGLTPNVEYGRSAINTTENWILLSNVNLGFFSSTWDGTKKITLDEFDTTTTLTWNGSLSSSWTSVENWTPNAGPAPNINIIIPDSSTTLNDPTLPLITEIKSLFIKSNGLLNSVDSAQLTINGGSSAWVNMGGTFSPGTSNVIFTNNNATIAGSTNFYNLTTTAGKTLWMENGSTMKIAGAIFNNGTWQTLTSGATTVEYNGANQTVITPNGTTSGYYNLILSASGVKTLPASAMTIYGNFSMNDSVSATAGAALTINGNVLIGSGTAFVSGNYSHMFKGNFENDGSFTATSGNSVHLAGNSLQSVLGASATTFNNLIIENSIGVNLYSNVTVNGGLNLTSGNLNVGEMVLGINGTITKSAGFLDVHSQSSLSFGGSTVLNIPDNLFLSTPSINNLTINRTGGVGLDNQDLTVNGLINLLAGVLNLGANTLTISGSSPTRINGTIDGSNAGATLAFTNSSAIILPASIFTENLNNLTINGSGGVTSLDDFAVNGVLNLQSENPSATKGSLDMWDGTTVKILTMGANATTIGTGDVTGIIKRTTINPEITYTFGSQHMSVFFYNDGILPTEISAKVRIGTTPSWKTGAINRDVEIIQSGGTGTQALFTYHYLDSELNGNDEEHLVLWSKYNNLEYGRSSYSPTENWVSLSNVNVAFFPSSWDGMRNITLDEYSNTTTLTWNGSLSDSWTSVENWTPNVGPSSIMNIIIPDASTTAHSPTLPAVTEIKTLTIDAAGVLNSVPNAQLTINGGSSAWINYGGTFNANTSSVAFTNTTATITGVTNFYNININDGDGLWMERNSTMRIAGTVTNNGIWRTVIGGPTIVEYNGENQTVVVPNPETNRYSTLILSGSGTKTLPVTDLNILGDFSVSGVVVANANANLNIDGSINIGSNATFNAGSYNHSIAGNFENNGTIETTSGSSVTFDGTELQTVSRNSPTAFEKLVINNLAGVSLLSNFTVNDTLVLENGNLKVGESTFQINGTISKVAGFIDVLPTSSLSFGGTNALMLNNNLFTSTPSINNLVIDKSDGLTLGNQNMTVNGLLNLLSGSLVVGPNSLIVAGESIARTSGAIDASDTSSTLVFANVNALNLPSSAILGSVNHLKIAGAGGVTTNSDITINKTLEFESGLVHTGSNVIIMGNSANDVIGAASDKYVDGNFRKIGNTAFTFPVGNNGQYAPISISAADGGGNINGYFTANYVNSMPHATYDSTHHDASIVRISSVEYWMLERSGANNVYVTLSWGARSGGISNLNDLTVAHWNESLLKWEDVGNTATTGSTISGTITSGLVSNFSPFTLASKMNSNLLSVSFISFESKCENNQTMLTWTTASELNNSYFEVQNSTDGRNWTSLSKVNGVGNSTQIKNYKYLDASTQESSSLYRLKQVDFNGNYTYSNIIASKNCSESLLEPIIYPNPTVNIVYIQTSGSQDNVRFVEVYNLLGEKVFGYKGFLPSIDLGGLQNGIYYIHILYDSNTVVKKIVLNKP